MAAKSQRILLCLLLLLMAVGLAYSSYQQWEYFDQPQPNARYQMDDSGKSLGWLAGQEVRQLERRVANLTLTLEYMVWPREQEKIRLELAQALKMLINLRTLSGALWENLLAVQIDIPDQQSELSFTLSQLLGTMEWRTKSFRPLVYYCVHLDSKISEQTRRQCKTLIAQASPIRHVHDHKQLLGLTAEEYDALVTEARSSLD